MLARFQEGTGGNIWLKLEKLPNFPTFLKGIFQIVPSTYEHLCLHIPDLSQPSSNLRKGNKQLFSVLSTVSEPQGGTSILGGRGAWPQNLPLKFLLEPLQNIGDKYPKFCPPNFRFDPKIGIFSQLSRLVITELPKFWWTWPDLAQILPPNLMWGPSPRPTS